MISPVQGCLLQHSSHPAQTCTSEARIGLVQIVHFSCGATNAGVIEAILKLVFIMSIRLRRQQSMSVNAAADSQPAQPAIEAAPVPTTPPPPPPRETIEQQIASGLVAPLVQQFQQDVVIPELQQLGQQLSPCWPHLTIMGVIGFVISLFLGIQKIILALQQNPHNPQLLEEFIEIALNVSKSTT